MTGPVASIQFRALEGHGKAAGPRRVLVLPGGTELGLEIQRGLSLAKEVELLGAGSDDDQHGPFAYRRHLKVPSVHEPGWLDALEAVVERERVDFVYPAHDDVLLALSKQRDRLSADLVASPHETNRIARSKRLTYEALAENVPVPRVFADPEEVDAFPVFVKPDRSQGSRGARVARNRQELDAAIADGADLTMELLPGREFTVDCFSDRRRGLLFARGRSRQRVRSGIATLSRPAGDQTEFRRLAERIAARLALHGAWFFQLREDAQGTLRLLEVGPRIAGTMAVHRVLGVNFPMLSLYERMGVEVELLVNDVDVCVDRPLTNRYAHNLRYGVVYVDLDDTLVVREQVNTRLVALIYQCLNEGRRIVLLTRHAGDLDETLARHRLGGLWDEVVHLEANDRKADAIRGGDAILIDDSFSERRSAHEQLGIATFDSSMVELLLDPRT